MFGAKRQNIWVAFFPTDHNRPLITVQKRWRRVKNFLTKLQQRTSTTPRASWYGNTLEEKKNIKFMDIDEAQP